MTSSVTIAAHGHSETRFSDEEPAFRRSLERAEHLDRAICRISALRVRAITADDIGEVLTLLVRARWAEAGQREGP